MLSVASVRQQSAKVAKGLYATLALGLFSVLSVPLPVYATTVGVSVHDTGPTSLTITTDIEGKTVTEPTVTIGGMAHNVTQVIAYVDNEYNTSLPLPSGAGSYTIIIGVTPGTHEVRIVGLDATTNTEASQTVHFSYEPAPDGGTTTGSTSSDGSSPVNDYLNNTIDAAKATQADAAQQVQKASSSGPLGDLSDLAFNAFKSVDLVSTTDGSGINKMAGRLTLVSAGLAATVFPWSAYALISKIRFIPKFAIAPGLATFGMRATGIALMAIPFLFMH